MWAFFRLVRASWLFGRILASYLLQLTLVRLLGRERMAARWRRIHRKNARRLYHGFVRLRGVYIKLGQILSIMGTFLPPAYGEELEGLQDEVPPRRYSAIRRTIAESLGKPPEELFESFETRALAAASLGQVHRATTAEGEVVAVKVLYPNVATIIQVDLRVLGWALRVYRWFVPVRQIERVHEQLTDMLSRETDLVHEARCLERMAKNFEDDPDILFPEVHHELSSDRVLTMSFMDGVKISKHEQLEEMGLDPNAVATKLVQAFYKQLFLDRFFHADPHPGNFFVKAGDAGQPQIVVLDFGAASEVSQSMVDGMFDILAGMMTRNDDKVLEGIERMGFVAEDGDRALLERTTRLYFEKLLNLDIQDFSKISPQVAHDLADPGLKRDELRELMKSVEYPHGWFFVERAVVILFGLSAQLAPKLNTVQVGFPYVAAAMASRRTEASA
ncbi:MAG: AarF/ABC1/UbiB kinase family protein [Deltaproteobacteria bacterium]|nr:AarF/ABC1/UbiB kinase family protein [Deltaproteobacteria bacterium]